MAEKEYIERGELIRTLNDEKIPYNADVNYFITNAPAADVVEVRHGEWIIKTDFTYIRKEKLYICPYCGKDYRRHMNFCGNCGAKMDGGSDDV